LRQRGGANNLLVALQQTDHLVEVMVEIEKCDVIDHFGIQELTLPRVAACSQFSMPASLMVSIWLRNVYGTILSEFGTMPCSVRWAREAFCFRPVLSLILSRTAKSFPGPLEAESHHAATIRTQFHLVGQLKTSARYQ